MLVEPRAHLFERADVPNIQKKKKNKCNLNSAYFYFENRAFTTRDFRARHARFRTTPPLCPV